MTDPGGSGRDDGPGPEPGVEMMMSDELNYEGGMRGMEAAIDELRRQYEGAMQQQTARRDLDQRERALHLSLSRKLTIFDECSREVAAPIEEVLADADAIADWLAGGEQSA